MTIEENLRTKATVKKGGAEASVLVGGTRYDLPISKGTLGPDAVDITNFYKDTGRFTYDLGFTSTASCESRITFIDFDKEIVLVR
jgi:citrate synthase